MRQSWHRIIGVAVLGLLAVTAAQSGARADEGPVPGLPPAMEPDGWLSSNWSGGTQAAVAKLAKQRQWARTPVQLSAANFLLKFPAFGHDPSKHLQSYVTRNAAYFVAEAGAEHNYGLTPPFTVRTVAFGAVPVEARVRLEQQRDDSGLPLPILFDTDTYYFREVPEPGWGNRYYNSDTEVADRMFVRVEALRVDGQDLQMAGRCRTATPGELRLHGEGHWNQEWIDAGTPPRYELGWYAAADGGLLTGTLDVGPFTGCTTHTGEDLSRLLTAAVSGKGNEVAAHVSAVPCGAAANGQLPPGPGFEPPEKVCNLLESPALPHGRKRSMS